jgi:hypothetical protein
VRSFGLEHRAQLHGLVHRFGEEAIAVAALVLRAVQRDVGLAHEVGAIGAVLGRERHADADADVRLVAEDLERAAQVLEDAVERALDSVVEVLLLEQDGELVAAEAGDGFGAAENPAQPAGDFLDQRIAGEVAEAVVDVLEPVEVEQQDRHLLPVPRADQRLVGGVVEQRPVRQPGEHVVVGEMVRLGFLGLELEVSLLEFGQVLVVALHQAAHAQRHQQDQQRDDAEYDTGREQQHVDHRHSGRRRLPEHRCHWRAGAVHHIGVRPAVPETRRCSPVAARLRPPGPPANPTRGRLSGSSAWISASGSPRPCSAG